MKKLFIISSLLITTLTFGQKLNRKYMSEPKDAVASVYKTLDSASTIYKKKIVMFSHTIIGDSEYVHFRYYKNDKISDTTIIFDKPHLNSK